MHIAIVTDAWEPQVNGVVTTLTNTIAELRRRGHGVDVVEPSQYPGISLPGLRGLKLAMPPFRLAERLLVADAIHIVTEGALGIGAKLYCDRKKLPYTTAFHTNWPSYFRRSMRIPEALVFPLLHWFHDKSAAMMAPSPSIVSSLRQRGFRNAVHWRRGVDGAIFNKTGPQASLSDYGAFPYWLSVGRVSKEKNLEAFLALDLPGTKIVVGDGPDRLELAARYPDARFLGERRGDDLASVYRAATVFVFPSRFDTFGLVMAEALSCGAPVAAYPVTGPIDVVENGRTGCLDDDLGRACQGAFRLAVETIPEVSFRWEDATGDFLSYLINVNNP